MRPWFEAISIGLVCGFLAGCQYNPWANGFLKAQPAEGDLVGTYKVDSDTLTRKFSIPMNSKILPISRDARIELAADHKVQFLQIPDVDEFAQRVCVISGTGSWQVNRNDDYAVIDVKIQRKDESRLHDECSPTYDGELMLYGLKPPYKLHITMGDPDSGDALQFEKAN